MKPLYFTSINADENRYRWYSIHIQMCLDGRIDVIRRWGRIGNGGQEMVEHFPDIEEAKAHINKIVEIRKEHGYIQAISKAKVIPKQVPETKQFQPEPIRKPQKPTLPKVARPAKMPKTAIPGQLSLF